MKQKNVNEISELKVMVLGGYEQKILIEGKRKDLPVVITLHGGPGTPIPFSVGCRGLFPEFTDAFIMVYWDQYGCGINDAPVTDEFSIQKFVDMTEDLVIEIRRLFPDNKILIFSTSWGSILSLKLLDRNPYAVDSVIAAGQIIKKVFLCDEVYEELSKTKISSKKLEQIKNITPDNYKGKDLQLISSSLRKYTNAYENKNGVKAPIGKILMGLLKSPDYKLKDFKAIMVNGYMKNNSLWKEILKLDLSENLCNVKIPYICLQGDTDIVASTRTIKDLVNSSNNELIECIMVEDTGHMPSKKMMDRLMQLLIEKAVK